MRFSALSELREEPSSDFFFFFNSLEVKQSENHVKV